MQRFKKHRLLLIVITVLLIVTGAIIWIATAANRKTRAFLAHYEITDLTALGLHNVVAINDKGQILGHDKQNRICIWDEQNGLKVLNIPQEAGTCWPNAFNNYGQIAGDLYTPSGDPHAFVWDANNGLIDLGTPGGTSSGANAINDLGHVVGCVLGSNNLSYPFLWDRNTGMLDLSAGNTIPKYRTAGDINNAGTVLGITFIWTRDKGMVLLDTPTGGQSFARSINNAGKIAGVFRKKSAQPKQHLIIWEDPNNWRDLGTPKNNARHTLSNPTINDVGQIVGLAIQYGILSNRCFHFFYSDETGFIDLGEIYTSDGRLKLPKMPWQSRSRPMPVESCVLDINNKGQIINHTKTKQGKYRTVLMTPKKAYKE